MKALIAALLLTFSMGVAADVEPLTVDQRAALVANCPAGEPLNPTKVKNCVTVNQEDRIIALEGAGSAPVPVGSLVDSNGAVVGSVIGIDTVNNYAVSLVVGDAGVAVVDTAESGFVGYYPAFFSGQDCTGSVYTFHNITNFGDTPSGDILGSTSERVVTDGTSVYRPGTGASGSPYSSRFDDGVCTNVMGNLGSYGRNAITIFDGSGFVLPFSISQ